MTQEPQRKMDGYRPGDMAIPTWALLQKTGGNWAKEIGGQPGQFYNSSSDEIAEELDLIVVDILMGRARWGPEISDAGPMCASEDAMSNLSLNGDDCTKCEYRLDTPWSSDASERRLKCCLNYTILGITIEDYMPCIIRAHGISALPVRQLLTQLRLNRAIKGEYFRAVVNVRSQEKAGRHGAAFALKARIKELITDPGQAKQLKDQSDNLLGTPLELPEGRPEDDLPEPLGYSPQGVPYYSEAEKDRLIQEEQTIQEPTTAAPPVKTEPEPTTAAPPVKTEPATGTAATEDKIARQIETMKQATEEADQALKKEEDTTKAADIDFDF